MNLTPPSRVRLSSVLILMLAAACSPADGAAGPTTAGTPGTSPATTTSSTTSTTTTTTTTTLPPRYALHGRVFGVGGDPLHGATVTVGDSEVITGARGVFSFPPVALAPIEIVRPAYRTVVIDWDGSPDTVPVTMEPIVAKALRVASETVRDDDRFQKLLDLAAASAVDALVFDTKQEGGTVLYNTAVREAHDIGAVLDIYDPAQRIAQAHDAGLYTITRVVSFEDTIRAKKRPEYKLAGAWINVTNPDTWEYPIDLGVEACELGFDEIQFDYVRFPTGQASVQSAKSHPTTGEERVATIAAFLKEARDRIHPLGCAVAAAVFAIVFSAPNDQGIGQRPEDLSGIVDVLSPMIYPSHYGNGWLGFADPNDYPGEVTAGALDDGMPRVGGGTIVRPWLQAFWWTDAQIREAIDVTESRGLGWMLWNAAGNYDVDALPDSIDDSDG